MRGSPWSRTTARAASDSSASAWDCADLLVVFAIDLACHDGTSDRAARLASGTPDQRVGAIPRVAARFGADFRRPWPLPLPRFEPVAEIVGRNCGGTRTSVACS